MGTQDTFNELDAALMGDGELVLALARLRMDGESDLFTRLVCWARVNRPGLAGTLRKKYPVFDYNSPIGNLGRGLGLQSTREPRGTMRCEWLP